MGYTHYWRLNREGNQEAYSAALVDIAEIVRHAPVPLGGGDCDVAEPVELSDEAICFNGVGPDGHEPFVLMNRLAGTEQACLAPGWAFVFCKTAEKPYDVVVTAALCRLAEVGTNTVRVSSDSVARDWAAGRALASAILDRPVYVPSAVAWPDGEVE